MEYRPVLWLPACGFPSPQVAFTLPHDSGLGNIFIVRLQCIEYLTHNHSAINFLNRKYTSTVDDRLRARTRVVVVTR
ncbi:hypothetical protein E2C01_038780 [Portunus trituberculatus]|uniref:Uncharacterized protein n=1 Tax=Portunus trituberculatus TaxID=210409 RepID=A0A5B7FHP3_PORTR|nr:hypothetical protein [Portunus trituberculatus]